jgi:hypothetical protein
MSILPESLVDWHQLANIFQGFATGLAVIVGAVWATFRFWSLREIAQSKVKLEKELREFKERQPIIDLTMKAEQVAGQNGDSFFVTVQVTAKNYGTKIARLAYEGDPPLGIFSIEFPHDGSTTFIEKQREHVRLAFNPTKFAKTTIIRPGQTQEIPFLVKISSPGWYFLAYRAVQSKEDRELLQEAGVHDDRIVSWTAKQYVQVCEHNTVVNADTEL